MQPTSERVPVSPVDTTTVDFVKRPIESYEEIRRVGRMVYLPSARALLITGYDDAATVLRNPKWRALYYPKPWERIGNKVGRDYSAAVALLSHMPFAHEGPRHRSLRAAMAAGIAPVAGGSASMHATIAGSLKRALKDGGFDLAADFANHLLFDVMCDMMHIPQEDRAGLRPMATLSWAVESTISVRDRQVVSDETAKCVEYLRAHAVKVIEESDDGLLPAMYRAAPPEDDDKLTTTAILATVMLVMGNDALGACISMGARRLLDEHRPTAMRQPQWSTGSDDSIRYSSPVDYVIRGMTEDGVIAGCPVMKGDYLFTSMLAANHDPAHFGDRGETISAVNDVGLAFGAGRHLCVGSRITRTIVKSAFGSLAELPRMRQAGKVVHGRGKLVRTLESLPVEFV